MLSLTEALAFQRAQQPLPSEVESIASRGDTLIVTIDARERMPKLLRRVAPKLVLNLTFEAFEAGRAAFRVNTALSAVPVNALVQMLLKIVSLPDMKGVTLEVSGDTVRAWVDVQGLISEQIGGLTLTDFALVDDTFVVEAGVGDIVMNPSEAEQSRPVA